MKVVVEGKSVTLSDKDLLGQGGEALVYRHGARALKLYRPMPAPELHRRVEKLAEFPKGLPDRVLGPLALVTDPSGEAIGFAMRAVQGAEDVKRLGERRFREGLIAHQAVLDLHKKLHGLLSALHAKGVVVGDLNDSNVVFTTEAGGELAPWLLDADSMQFGRHLCAVGHERFLDPALYGVDLSAGPAFDAGTDWYSFCVMLFSSLLYVHPYGGVHPVHGTLLRRAEARHSVLRTDVKRPKTALDPGLLPDPLLERFEAVFDRGARGTFPEKVLDFRFASCACGLEHARPACPACAQPVLRAKQPPVLVHGRATCHVIHRTRGRVLAAAWQGGLRWVSEENGVVRREDGARVLAQPLVPGMRFAISGRSTWIGLGTSLVEVKDERPAARATVETFMNAPAFDASSAGCFSVEGDALVETATRVRHGSVLGGQTFVRAGERAGYGFYRAGQVTVHFLFTPGRPGTFKLELPPFEGRLVAADAVFDDAHALISAETEARGRRRAACWLVSTTGARALIAGVEGAPEDHPLLAFARGKVLGGGKVLVATDRGLAVFGAEPATRSFAAGEVFTETEPFVSAGTDLLPGPGGSVHAVSTKEIVQIRRSS